MYGSGHCWQTNPEVAKNHEMRKMFICSVQINSSYNENAHILRLSFLVSILLASADSCFSVCRPCWWECKWTYFATAKRQDIWFSWCSFFGRLVLFFIFSTLFVVEFDVLCLQLIYNYCNLTNLTKLNSPNKRKRLKCHCIN